VVRGYRSGYLARQRREIERGLRAGQVRTVVATSALELGIDIGGMDACLLAGYPGTVASTWQQAGRAGRGTKPSLAVLVTSSDPLEQFLAHNPDYLFGRSPEHALIDADNPLVLLDHVRCAAHELPFDAGGGVGHVNSERVQEYLRVLVDAGELHRSGDRTFWLSDRYPAADVSLRSASPTRVLIHEGTGQEQDHESRPAVVGEVDQASVHWMVHPGAVYIHQGQTYLVDALDLEQNLASVHSVEIDYYTQPRSETTIELLELWESASERGAEKRCGDILVTSQVTGYRKLRWFTQEPIGEGEVDLPPTQLLTAGYWFVLAESTVDALRQRGLWGSDPNRYGPHWARQRDRARVRDGYRCQVCGVREGSPATRAGAHHVHHKVPFRSFASSERANRLDNLVTLCPRCHLRVEQAVRVRSGLSGLAYLLSRLAPLYLMCDRGDIGVQSDPRSPLADKRPAVIFYDRVPGGLGFSRRLYDLHQTLIARAEEWVTACPCTDGCPSCVGPPGEDGAGSKGETTALLSLLSQASATPPLVPAAPGPTTPGPTRPPST
jgi:DEAD/DEAH box helicase domain-containing protein